MNLVRSHPLRALPISDLETYLLGKWQLTREIIDHETTHGTCTQTFMKKVRKQIRPRA